MSAPPVQTSRDGERSLVTISSEIAAVTQHLPAEASVADLSTYGEIARCGGQLGFHDQTMVVLAVQ